MRHPRRRVGVGTRRASTAGSVGRIDQRAPEIIILVVAVLLGAAAIAFGGGGDSEERDESLPSEERIAEIERDVERLRGRRFKTPVEPEVVSPDQARQAALRDVDDTYPPAERRADEELLKLLGLIPPETDVLEVLKAVAGEQVIGYYDTRRKELRLVSGNGADSPALVDVTLAHEMVHALEDQVFGLKEPEGTTDDESSARSALHEGTATYVMNRFVQCCVDVGQLALGSLASLFGAGGNTDLPPYVERTLLFSYTGGEEFIRQLHDATGDWSLVDAALTSQPPVSTEQIIHPDKYVPFEPPLEVKLDLGGQLGDGWKRSADGTLGELDTRELMRLGDASAATDAAAGWGGGRYELWQRTGAPPAGCKPPCRQRDALVLSWRWDTARDAQQFNAALRFYVIDGLGGKPVSVNSWGLEGGAVAVARRPRATTLAFAPTADLARRLSERAPVSER